MIFKAKPIVLKNGAVAELRSPAISEAAQMLQFIKTACGETDYLLRYPEEWESMTIAQEEAWIEQQRSSPNVLAITCFVGGKVAGNCEIGFQRGLKTAHRASIAIAILREYWSLGIGTALLQELISAARVHPGTEIVELELIEGNDRARHLYEKLGFHIIAERPNAYKLRDGTSRREFYMQKYL